MTTQPNLRPEAFLRGNIAFHNFSLIGLDAGERPNSKTHNRFTFDVSRETKSVDHDKPDGAVTMKPFPCDLSIGMLELEVC